MSGRSSPRRARSCQPHFGHLSPAITRHSNLITCTVLILTIHKLWPIHHNPAWERLPGCYLWFNWVTFCSIWKFKALPSGNKNRPLWLLGKKLNRQRVFKGWTLIIWTSRGLGYLDLTKPLHVSVWMCEVAFLLAFTCKWIMKCKSSGFGPCKYITWDASCSRVNVNTVLPSKQINII